MDTESGLGVGGAGVVEPTLAINLAMFKTLLFRVICGNTRQMQIRSMLQ